MPIPPRATMSDGEDLEVRRAAVEALGSVQRIRSRGRSEYRARLDHGEPETGARAADFSRAPRSRSPWRWPRSARRSSAGDGKLFRRGGVSTSPTRWRTPTTTTSPRSGTKLGFDKCQLLRAHVRLRRKGRTEYSGRAARAVIPPSRPPTAAWACSPASAKKSRRRRCNWPR